jgi:hypothetical protein
MQVDGASLIAVDEFGKTVLCPFAAKLTLASFAPLKECKPIFTGYDIAIVEVFSIFEVFKILRRIGIHFRVHILPNVPVSFARRVEIRS